MNKTELVQQLAARGVDDAEAALDAVASIIWHELEQGGEVDWPRVGRFGHATGERGRRAVAFRPATELEVAVNRHHVAA